MSGVSRPNVSLATLDSVNLASFPSLRSFLQIESALPVLNFFQMESLSASRSFTNAGILFSVYKVNRPGSTLSASDVANVGASISLQASPCLELNSFAFSLLRADPTMLILDDLTVDSLSSSKELV